MALDKAKVGKAVLISVSRSDYQQCAEWANLVPASGKTMGPLPFWEWHAASEGMPATSSASGSCCAMAEVSESVFQLHSLRLTLAGKAQKNRGPEEAATPRRRTTSVRIPMPSTPTSSASATAKRELWIPTTACFWR